jgi:hypothetical protein
MLAAFGWVDFGQGWRFLGLTVLRLHYRLTRHTETVPSKTKDMAKL